MKTLAAPQRIIFERGKPGQEQEGKPIKIEFHRSSRPPAPGFDGNGRGGGNGWVLEAGQSPGRLIALVSTTRRRNMSVAVLMNLLLLATGITLLRYTHRSRRLADAQMRFVANVSHELRTPLTVIRGASHNLMKGVVDGREKAEEYAKLIMEHSELLSDMVEQVLELGAIKSKRPLEDGQQGDVAKTIADAVGATVHETKGINLEIQLAPALAPVRGDASALRRVPRNTAARAAGLA